MANPQLEKGYTPISNEVLEVLYRTDFTATELKIILLVMRSTYGFSRKEYKLSLSYISNGISVSKRYVSSAVSKLIEDNIIVVVKEHTETQSRIIKFNKDYDSWMNRKTGQQMKYSSTDEVQFNTTDEVQFNTTDEVQFNKKNKYKTNIKQENTSKSVKRKYGEFNHVLLTDDEKERLILELGQDIFNKCIVKLDEYIEMKGYKAKNHNLCIRKWVINAVKGEENKKKGEEVAYGDNYSTGNCYSMDFYDQFRGSK